jgi:hypothetical protein
MMICVSKKRNVLESLCFLFVFKFIFSNSYSVGKINKYIWLKTEDVLNS